MFKEVNIGHRKCLIDGQSAYYRQATENKLSLLHIEKLLPLINFSSPVIFDVGSNIGIVALRIALNMNNGTLHCFEPHPKTFDFLKANINKNFSTSSDVIIETHNFGLSSEEGVVNFRDIPDYDTGNAIIKSGSFSDQRFNTVPVTIKKLDDFVDNHKINRIDFMKIDVEGFELDVLDGGQKCISNIQGVVLEFNHWCITMYREMLPTDALTRLFDYFKFIFVYDRCIRAYKEISYSTSHSFLHKHMLTTHVDDLFCTNDTVMADNLRVSSSC